MNGAIKTKKSRENNNKIITLNRKKSRIKAGYQIKKRNKVRGLIGKGKPKMEECKGKKK